MRLISRLRIEGFRSIREAELDGLADFTTLAGLNNSGKSNVLRALNAFFVGQTDPGVPVNVDSDYFRPDLKKKKAKRIRIAIRFTLPQQFKFRAGLEPVEALLGGQDFEVAKEWRRDQPAPDYFLDGHRLDDLNDRERIEKFLQLINFRYIPNRVLPLDVIRGEHQALRDVLVRRLGKAGNQQAAFDAIGATSAKLIEALAKRFRDAYPAGGDVRLATPTSWSDLAFAFGYRLARGDVEIDDAAQGSGIQSLLMLETLYLIDRDYFQKFGWRQAALWVVEEPESSLHSSLEARVAAYLHEIATDPTSRLQVLATTHSHLMIEYANRSFLAREDGGQARFTAFDDGRSAVQTLAAEGVSHWAHPILHHPLDPLVLVEGKYDYDYLRQALLLLEPQGKVRVSYLGEMDDDAKTGGVDDLLKYVKANASAVRTRPKGASVIVVLDWDAAGKAPQFMKPFGQDDPVNVLTWPEDALNRKLGPTFRGIERAYSDRIIREAERRGVVVFRASDGSCSIEPTTYGETKKILNAVVQEGLRDSDLAPSRSFLREIVTTTKA